jgi:pSer/pThr/pTyr-binding forkhead associated (FHA) protein
VVSRHHCEIVVQQDAVLLRDVGSKNGTFVEGKRIDGPTELKDGDVFNMGLVLLRIQICDNGEPLLETNRLADVTAEPDRLDCCPVPALDCSL